MIRAQKFSPQSIIIESFLLANKKEEELALEMAGFSFVPRYTNWDMSPQSVLLLKLARFSNHGYEFLPKKNGSGKNIWIAIKGESVFDCSSSPIGHPNISGSGELCLGDYGPIMKQHGLFDSVDSKNIRYKTIVISNIISEFYTNPNVDDSYSSIYRSDKTQCKCPVCKKDHFVSNDLSSFTLDGIDTSSNFINTVKLGINQLFCCGVFNELYEKFSTTTCPSSLSLPLEQLHPRPHFHQDWPSITRVQVA